MDTQSLKSVSYPQSPQSCDTVSWLRKTCELYYAIDRISISEMMGRKTATPTKLTRSFSTAFPKARCCILIGSTSGRVKWASWCLRVSFEALKNSEILSSLCLAFTHSWISFSFPLYFRWSDCLCYQSKLFVTKIKVICFADNHSGGSGKMISLLPGFMRNFNKLKNGHLMLVLNNVLLIRNEKAPWLK